MSNYFVGRDPRAWRAGVPHYRRVRYQEVYPGVDLVYYGAGRELEYDFLVAPGADPARIQMSYDGASSVRVDAAGDLRIAVPGGEVVHRKPHTFEIAEDGARRGALQRERGERFRQILDLHIEPARVVLEPAQVGLGGGDAESLLAVACDGAVVELGPGSLSFNAPPGQERDSYLSFTNDGTSFATVYLNAQPPFASERTSITLGPHDRQFVRVTYTGGAPGSAASGQLWVDVPFVCNRPGSPGASPKR